ncbi:unnamed protein product [Bursaphelenchus xylophilus]|uniref:(pine wood nematode) hypothetical protein n=1 Tax=Bursaphelenchus xylophilus TaxID=6326 RepID=A0A1I7S9D1_BURXY|nr:unnamed protein product [Bursaphelenchus xylophilus]CAG9100531.1 unnamed protein product [Bursaphelenchus xylophilus]
MWTQTVCRVLASLTLALLNFTTITASHSKARLNVYFEPQNMESTRFFKSQLLPLYENTELGDRVELRLVPHGRAHCDNVEKDYVCSCPHGDDECELMYLMSCILHDFRHHGHAVDTIACIQGQSSMQSALDECIVPLRPKQRKWYGECSNTFRGHYLSWLQGLRTNALGMPLSNVPFLVLDGHVNDIAIENLQSEICAVLAHPKPAVCE